MYKVTAKYSNGYSIPAYELQDEAGIVKSVMRKDFITLCILHKIINCKITKSNNLYKLHWIGCDIEDLPTYCMSDINCDGIGSIFQQVFGGGTACFVDRLVTVNQAIHSEMNNIQLVIEDGDIRVAMDIRKSLDLMHSIPSFNKAAKDKILDDYYEKFERATLSDKLLKEVDEFFSILAGYSPEDCRNILYALNGYSNEMRFIMHELPCSKFLPSSISRVTKQRHAKYLRYLGYDDFYCKAMLAEGKEVMSLRNIVTEKMTHQKSWAEEKADKLRNKGE